jgi:hypothetical protein
MASRRHWVNGQTWTCQEPVKKQWAHLFAFLYSLFTHTDIQVDSKNNYSLDDQVSTFFTVSLSLDHHHPQLIDFYIT